MHYYIFTVAFICLVVKVIDAYSGNFEVKKDM